MMDANISPDTFDGAAIWQTLPADARDAIGAAALELCAAHFCFEECHDGAMFATPESRAADAAVTAADAALHQLFVDAVAQSELTDGEDRLKFPSVLGMVCRTCGCSQNDACAGGCDWAEPNLCTACQADGRG